MLKKTTPLSMVLAFISLTACEGEDGESSNLFNGSFSLNNSQVDFTLDLEEVLPRCPGPEDLPLILTLRPTSRPIIGPVIGNQLEVDPSTCDCEFEFGGFGSADFHQITCDTPRF